MKKMNCLVAGVLLVSTLACFAAPREDLNCSVLRINGVAITKTAAQINAGNTSTLTVTNVTITVQTRELTNVVDSVTNVYTMATNAVLTLQRVP